MELIWVNRELYKTHNNTRVELTEVLPQFVFFMLSFSDLIWVNRELMNRFHEREIEIGFQPFESIQIEIELGNRNTKPISERNRTRKPPL